MTTAKILEAIRSNPFRQVDSQEICELTGLPKTTVEMIRRAPDSPFISGRTRPERFSAWLDSHLGWKPSEER